MQNLFLFFFLITSQFAFADQSNKPAENLDIATSIPTLTFRFEKVLSKQSNIDFNNQINEDQVHNFFNFSYIYNGAGVAVGDINNDGLADIYFSGNQVKNRLYLNEGGFRFRDITESAFTKADNGWKNGVTMIDINHDGLLDIYVCQSGLYQNDADRENKLYINQGNLTFTEEAKKFGLNDPGFSIQAYFFDYDRDNDLDLFLINHRHDFENNNLVTARDKIKYDRLSSDQLYQNINGSFTNVTEKSGIINFAWGLSAVIYDFNNDGWDDIYVANDYVEPDNLYINNRDGTFTESVASHMKHTSYYSMGSDLADINNDGLQDLMVLDMVPEDHVRAKRLMAPMSTENFWRLIDSGLHYQYMLNTLQLNQGKGLFSEIAQLSGVDKTDWSWAPLFADFDNDGYADLFITNGIKRDITDNDFFIDLNRKVKNSKKPLSFNELIAEMPTDKLRNYLYHNQTNLTFQPVNEAANLMDLSNSNGAAYADFDNDGDMDLVVNNLDETASVYQNHQLQPDQQNHIKIKLAGPESNPQGIGAIISIKYGNSKQVKKMALSRGYLSSVEAILHFGLANTRQLEQISVLWPDGLSTIINQVKANQTLTIHYQDLQHNPEKTVENKTLFEEMTSNMGITHKHRETVYNDFKKEVLLPHKQSEHGPYISVADVNKDGLDDFFIGGSAGYSGKLFLQKDNQQFELSESQPWKNESASEDLGSLFFDSDNDGDLDLYVSSGSNEFPSESPLYRDRLYINNGFGQFTKSDKLLPDIISSSHKVISADYDHDGDMDLFIGGRVSPGQYPLTPSSYFLQNNHGIFSDATDSVAPEIKKIGMVTDALFVDYDNDNDLDLLVVGEWMPITFFENQHGIFVNETKQLGLTNTRGWWLKLNQGDFDKDGDMDFVAGNMGLNNKYHPSVSKPLTLFANDFDQNGSLDIVLSSRKDNRDIPIRGRECSATQMPGLLKKFPTFQSFALADMKAIYPENKLDSANKFQAELFSHSIIINNGVAGFSIKPLPIISQLSPMSGVVVQDFNHDNHLDILYSGNFYGAEVETVRYDAGIGGLLNGNGVLAEFNPVKSVTSGFLTPNDARDIKHIRLGKNKQTGILVSNNQGPIQLFKLSVTKTFSE